MSFPISKRVLTLVAVAISTIIVAALLRPTSSAALPDYAAKTGQTCAACHVNPAGGGARTADGQAFEAIPTHATDPAGAWSQVADPAPAAPPAATVAPASPPPAGAQSNQEIAKGGRLYDEWWTEDGLAPPEGNQPLWALQSTNTRTGTTTWRCKECHGWDYKGKDGVYGSGSRMTGFPGVFEAGAGKTADELMAILNGTAKPEHDFSILGEESMASLVDFLQLGLIDNSQYIDYSSKKPVGADIGHGQGLYESDCASCHGADGTVRNFGTNEEPIYVGTLAVDNPWEVLHKIRVGQPAAAMPFALGLGWSTQDAVDVLGYAQTLPAAVPAAAPEPTATAAAAVPAALPRTGEPASTSPVMWLALAGLIAVGGGLATRRRLQNRT